MVPAVVPTLTNAGHQIRLEAGAGTKAGIPDQAYADAGVEVVHGAAALEQAEVVLKVQAPTPAEVAGIPSGATVVALFAPGRNLDTVRALAQRGVTSHSLELLPRTTRAQTMDALSSQSTVAGYRGVLLAATRLPRFFPMFMTAAGTVPPTKVLVLGAGVAGLQAIATARRLGAVVSAFDVRSAARGEVESLGGKFVDLGLESADGTGGYAAEQTQDAQQRQREALTSHLAAADVVLTTAQIPGRPAPVLVTATMLAAMKPGSVVIDLASDSGGNVEGSDPAREVDAGGVIVVGVANPASGLATHASQLYARNLANFVALVSKDGALAPDYDDDIVRDTCVTRDGRIVHEPTRSLVETGGAPVR